MKKRYFKVNQYSLEITSTLLTSLLIHCTNLWIPVLSFQRYFLPFCVTTQITSSLSGPTCGQAFPWNCQWHPRTLTLYSELTTKAYSLPCSTIMWDSLGTTLTHIVSGAHEALKVGWTGTVSVMEVHYSAGPSREPASGRTACWEPLAVIFFLRLRFLWFLPVTKHGRTQNPAISVWCTKP